MIGMDRLRPYLQRLIWNLLSERAQLEIELRLAGHPLLHPSEVPTPTILEDTRCELERLRDVEFSGYLPGLSENVRVLVERSLKALVKDRLYTATFPMATLHGCSASKARYRPDRAGCDTMAELGELINDLKDLEGKSGGDIVSACLAWSELRLHEGISLTTDNWHRRFYWSNAGGSHHMAVLCYELQRQEKQWQPEVEIKEFSLNVEALEPINNVASLFVITPKPGSYGLDRVFKPLNYRQAFSELHSRLGVELLSLGAGQGILSRYDLVVVDHSKKYASLSLKRLSEAVAAGYAITFEEFLLSWSELRSETEYATETTLIR